jgi:hypothetical protein
VYGKAQTVHQNQIQQPSLPLWPLLRETTDSAVGCLDFECTKMCFLINWNLKDFVSGVLFSGEISLFLDKETGIFSFLVEIRLVFAKISRRKNEKENSVYNLFQFIIIFLKES